MHLWYCVFGVFTRAQAEEQSNMDKVGSKMGNLEVGVI